MFEHNTAKITIEVNYDAKLLGSNSHTAMTSKVPDYNCSIRFYSHTEIYNDSNKNQQAIYDALGSVVFLSDTLSIPISIPRKHYQRQGWLRLCCNINIDEDRVIII
ncbi:hypothetical protein AVI51_12335 [Piscirickettsia salmonis]|uniref:hypothetical protein n=1 Tax=Piscirickettsia salmonis TaxID=1238 RepID=UPI00050A2611|nr:hypothetical protein [Piscirickettsia salmonis]WGZ72667.1 hypothetical protein E3220_14480 [Piscirickettsia salmonis EM-90]APS43639.1 hypothetical protein AVI48_04140 [Piscirickettsia salmonis]APS46994.1 hypothetical protein AVI49_04750 [Piscirickettsia salmonis]APS51557.1 hypothetical protein AVI50_12445 [Piscirickettsia salmonis]APS54771.1 hypothetical protein AVI51_12335 [Piscirickettsia salmonis]